LSAFGRQLEQNAVTLEDALDDRHCQSFAGCLGRKFDALWPGHDYGALASRQPWSDGKRG